jgi:hypothetical protein
MHLTSPNNHHHHPHTTPTITTTAAAATRINFIIFYVTRMRSIM